MIVNLLSDINLHIKENESSDDITLLAIKYSGTKLIISNKIEELYKVTEFIEQMGLQLGLSPALTMNLNLALEEAISNVIQYGYRQKAESRKQCRGDLHGRPMAESNVGATFTAAQWQNGEDELIEITAELIENKLILTLTDCGDEFDPTLIEAPDITLSAEDRPIGGLGFFLIRQIMNEVEYRRVDNKNVLTMSKILST
jgi:anti-sigma regulatory factor (Ser/Thr protein kinase)